MNGSAPGAGAPFPDVAAILFDAGGTLIHVDGRRLCAAAGLDFDQTRFDAVERDAVAAVSRWIRERPESTDAERLPLFLDAILTGLGAPAESRAASARAVAAEHRRENLWSSAFSGADRVLEILSGRGYRLGVVSNADGRVRALLDRVGLLSRLEIVVDSAEAGFEKPDPRIFLAATERLGLAPAACAYVGDIYEIDVAGARAAGLAAILIGGGQAADDTPRVETLDELPALFPGAGASARGPGSRR